MRREVGRSPSWCRSVVWTIRVSLLTICTQSVVNTCGGKLDTPVPLTPVRSLGTIASLLIVAVCVSGLWCAWLAWHTHSVVSIFFMGGPPLRADDYLGDVVVLSQIVNDVVSVAAGVVFFIWLWRARVNSERMTNAKHGLDRFWVVGAWFCPVVNLWWPRRIVDDIWRASRPGKPDGQERIDILPVSPLVRVWWLTLIADLAMVEALRWVVVVDTLAVNDVRTIALYPILSTVLLAVAGALLIRVIRQITEWQSSPRVMPSEFAQQ